MPYPTYSHQRKIFADLPPSSSVDGISFSAAASATSLPTSVEPVNASFLKPLCFNIELPTPEPGTCDYIKDTCRKNILNQSRKLKHTQRCCARRFKDGTASACKNWCQLPCSHQKSGKFQGTI